MAGSLILDSGGKPMAASSSPVRIGDGVTEAIQFAGAGSYFGNRFSGVMERLFAPQLAAAAYLCSGMLQKVIDIPASDRVREWRDWQTESAEIGDIEKEERRLQLVAKTKFCEVLRGVGGGALIIVTAGSHEEELNPATISKGGLVALNVARRGEIIPEDFDLELTSPTCGEPGMWRVSTGAASGYGAKIHPSRVIAFRGDPYPAAETVSQEDRYWGISKLLRVYSEVQKSDDAQRWFAELVRKAKLLRIGIPNLTDFSTDTAQSRLNRRMAAIAQGEGILNAVVYDAGSGKDSANPGEQIDDYQITWAGIPAMMDAFDQRVAAVADIPFTRLMGRSPSGLNSTGESDQENWNKMVVAGQKLELRPCLERLDPVLLRSAGIADPSKVTWKFAPLSVPTEKEQAETFNVEMEAVEKLQATGAIPEQAFVKSVQNLMSEREYLPGIDAALAELPEDERFGLNKGPDGTDPSAITQSGNGAEGGDPTSAGGGSGGSVPARRAANDARFTDAAPRTLYVRRDIINVAELKAWAKAQGLTELQAGLHVTICHIDQPFDWMKVEGDWNQSDTGEMTIAPGGVRIVEPLGNRTAVLLFTSSQLSWRHESILRSAEAQDKFPQYQPHISLTGEQVDLSKVQPYRGKIVLGPEIFEEVREDFYGGGDLSQSE